MSGSAVIGRGHTGAESCQALRDRKGDNILQSATSRQSEAGVGIVFEGEVAKTVNLLPCKTGKYRLPFHELTSLENRDNFILPVYTLSKQEIKTV